MHINAYRRLTEEGLPIGVIRNQPLGSILLNDNTKVPLYLVARLVVEIFNEEKSSRANWKTDSSTEIPTRRKENVSYQDAPLCRSLLRELRKVLTTFSGEHEDGFTQEAAAAMRVYTTLTLGLRTTLSLASTP